MNKRTMIAWAVDFMFSLAFFLAVPVSLLLILASFLWSRVPTEAGFATFSAIVGLWTYTAAIFCVAVAVLHKQIDRSLRIFVFMILLATAMLARVGPSIDLFREVWIVLGALITLFIMQLIDGPAKARTMQLRGSDMQQSQREEVAIRYTATLSSVSFADVAGMSEVKGTLLAAAREIVAAKGGAKVRNGMLLSGKPGNGKTFMAEALAGELKLPIISVSFGDMASKWVNDTTENVIQLFRDARRQAPCVLFIDEIDSMIANRSGMSSDQEGPRTTNAILTELVKIRQSGVVLVAATNFIDRLDPAAIREGRFDFKIEVTPPDEAARRHLITRKSHSAISEETIETAVRRWEGFSVSRIAATMEEANRMVKPIGGTISFQVLQGALRKVQGRKGHIPENTPSINELTLGKDSRQRLLALAKRMDKIMEIEAMGGSVPRGLLFYGPPGTGKTLTARALAKTANWAFISVSGMDFISDPKKIDSVMEEASELRPCVVFIDEADDVFRDRRYAGNATVTNKLLAAMDGAGGRVPDVLFIAATNHPDAMDSAALRGGRFTEKIEFHLPDAGTLVEFLTKWKAASKASTASNLSLEWVAERLAGNSMANVNEILQMAVNNAIARLQEGEDKPVIDLADIDSAVETVQGSIAA